MEIKVVKISMEDCKPCQDVIPQFEGVKEHFKENVKVSFEEWDVLKEAEKCIINNIKKTPTVIIFKNGSVMDNHEGPFIKKSIINKIQKQLDHVTNS